MQNFFLFFVHAYVCVVVVQYIKNNILFTIIKSAHMIKTLKEKVIKEDGK